MESLTFRLACHASIILRRDNYDLSMQDLR
jgi:hypothetical protein